MKPAEQIKYGNAVPLALGVSTLITRLALMDPFPFNMDNGQFAFAVRNGFDISLHQPHPPGYFLYVMTAKVVSLFPGDPFTALCVLSAVASGLFVPFIYLTAHRMFGRRAALAAGVIALTSPLLWLDGLVGLTYTVEAMASALIALTGLKAREGETRYLWLSALILGIAGGFRQTTIVFMYPLWLYCASAQGAQKAFYAHLLVAAGALSWLIPMLLASGGLEGYLSAVATQVNRSVWNGLSANVAVHHAAIQFYSASWALMAGLIPLLHVLYKRIRSGIPLESDPSNARFLLFWILPALVFYIIVISRGNNPDYVLVYSGALYIAAGAAVKADSSYLAGQANAPARNRIVLYAYIAVIALINTALFFGLNFNFSYRGMLHKNDISRDYIREIRALFRPGDTIIAGGDSFFVNYRQAGWFLPEYRTIYLPPFPSPGGAYYIECRDRTSRRLRDRRIPGGVRYAVYFGDIGTIGPPGLDGVAGAHLIDTPGGNKLLYFDLATYGGINDLSAAVGTLERRMK